MISMKQKTLRKSKLKDTKWKREIFEKYHHLSEDELSKKSNKNVYVKNHITTTVIKCCRAEKKAKEK